MLKQMVQAIANKNVSWKVKALSPFLFLKAISRAIYYKIIRKPVIVDDLKEEYRMSICSRCENNDHYVCLVCGCELHLKTMIASEVCPIGKWD